MQTETWLESAFLVNNLKIRKLSCRYCILANQKKKNPISEGDKQSWEMFADQIALTNWCKIAKCWGYRALMKIVLASNFQCWVSSRSGTTNHRRYPYLSKSSCNGLYIVALVLCILLHIGIVWPIILMANELKLTPGVAPIMCHICITRRESTMSCMTHIS